MHPCLEGVRGSAGKTDHYGKSGGWCFERSLQVLLPQFSRCAGLVLSANEIAILMTSKSCSVAPLNFSMYRNCFVDCEKWEGN